MSDKCSQLSKYQYILGYHPMTKYKYVCLIVFLLSINALLSSGNVLAEEGVESNPLELLRKEYPTLKSVEIDTYRFDVPVPKGDAYGEKQTLEALEKELERLKVLYIQVAIDPHDYRKILEEFTENYPEKFWHDSWEDITDLNSYILREKESYTSSTDSLIQKNMRANITALEEKIKQLKEYVSAYYPDPKYYDMEVNTIEAIHINNDNIIDIVYTYIPENYMVKNPGQWWGKGIEEYVFLKISSKDKGYRTVKLINGGWARTPSSVITIPWISSNENEVFLVVTVGDVLATEYYEGYILYHVQLNNKYGAIVEQVATFHFNKNAVNPNFSHKDSTALEYLKYQIKNNNKQVITQKERENALKPIPEEKLKLGTFKFYENSEYIKNNPEKAETLKKYWFNAVIE